MEKYVLVISILLIFAAVLIIIWNRIYIKKQILHLEEMLEAATNGTFHEKTFDETLMSQLENKLAQYIRENEVSSRNLADEKNKIKTLIADISHQTKTPIANMLLYSELLMEQNLSEDSLCYANQLYTQAEKLQFLISSLVKLSRLETGIMTYEPKVNDVSLLLSEIESTFMSRTKEKGISFIVESSSERAVFDPKWTIEAISNIVDNAFKYTDNGEIRVYVRKYEMFTSINIEDTGRGILESDQSKIFGRFYRGEQVHNEEGVGIGLFLAREIISGQGGYIKVSSKIGKGSVFSVYLQGS